MFDLVPWRQPEVQTATATDRYAVDLWNKMDNVSKRFLGGDIRWPER